MLKEKIDEALNGRYTVYKVSPMKNFHKDGMEAKFLEYLNDNELDGWMMDNARKYSMIVAARNDGKWVLYDQPNGHTFKRFSSGKDFNQDWKGKYNKKADVDSMHEDMNEEVATMSSKELKAFDSLKSHFSYSKTSQKRDANGRLVISFIVRFPVKMFEPDLKGLVQSGIHSLVINKDGMDVVLKESLKEETTMMTFKEFINEAKLSDKSIAKILDAAKIKYKSVKQSAPNEVEVNSGMDIKKGPKWDAYEDSIYKALAKANVDLSGDTSVFIN